MIARIYKPARNAMQSGQATSERWRLTYEPEQPREIDALMGWTSSRDMKQQLKLVFDTREQAVAYAERHGIPYRIEEPREPQRRKLVYSDNFAYTRQQPWTH